VSFVKKEYNYEDSLTNELLNQRFGSQFDLVRHAIKLAENKVRVGRDQTYPSIENVATEVLEEIASGQDRLEDIIAKEDETAGLNGQLNNYDSQKSSRGKDKSNKKETSKRKAKL
jgi:hypothetical protein